MRGSEVTTGAISIALGLASLVLLWIDQGHEPAKRWFPRVRLFWVVTGMWFLVTGLLRVVGGLRG